MSDPWFHHDPLPPVGDVASLDRDEARHVSGAHRLEVGATIVLFDGRGTTAHAELDEVSRRAVTARIRELCPHSTPRPTIHLASALPKGERLSTLLSMATQLGMSSFTPLDCARAVVRPNEKSDTSTARWNRIIREACKQSRRPHLPRIEESGSPVVIAKREQDAEAVVLALHPGGMAIAEYLAQSKISAAVAISLLVGPEGGFSDDEAAELRDSGTTLVDLGEGILRTETACAAGLALLGPPRS